MFYKLTQFELIGSIYEEIFSTNLIDKKTENDSQDILNIILNNITVHEINENTIIKLHDFITNITETYINHLSKYNEASIYNDGNFVLILDCYLINIVSIINIKSIIIDNLKAKLDDYKAQLLNNDLLLTSIDKELFKIFDIIDLYTEFILNATETFMEFIDNHQNDYINDECYNNIIKKLFDSTNNLTAIIDIFINANYLDFKKSNSAIYIFKLLTKHKFDTNSKTANNTNIDHIYRTFFNPLLLNKIINYCSNDLIDSGQIVQLNTEALSLLYTLVCNFKDIINILLVRGEIEKLTNIFAQIVESGNYERIIIMLKLLLIIYNSSITIKFIIDEFTNGGKTIIVLIEACQVLYDVIIVNLHNVPLLHLNDSFNDNLKSKANTKFDKQNESDANNVMKLTCANLLQLYYCIIKLYIYKPSIDTTQVDFYTKLKDAYIYNINNFFECYMVLLSYNLDNVDKYSINNRAIILLDQKSFVYTLIKPYCYTMLAYHNYNGLILDRHIYLFQRFFESIGLFDKNISYLCINRTIMNDFFDKFVYNYPELIQINNEINFEEIQALIKTCMLIQILTLFCNQKNSINLIKLSLQNLLSTYDNLYKKFNTLHLNYQCNSNNIAMLQLKDNALILMKTVLYTIMIVIGIFINYDYSNEFESFGIMNLLSNEDTLLDNIINNTSNKISIVFIVQLSIKAKYILNKQLSADITPYTGSANITFLYNKINYYSSQKKYVNSLKNLMNADALLRKNNILIEEKSNKENIYLNQIFTYIINLVNNNSTAISNEFLDIGDNHLFMIGHEVLIANFQYYSIMNMCTKYDFKYDQLTSYITMLEYNLINMYGYENQYKDFLINCQQFYCCLGIFVLNYYLTYSLSEQQRLNLNKNEAIHAKNLDEHIVTNPNSTQTQSNSNTGNNSSSNNDQSNIISPENNILIFKNYESVTNNDGSNTYQSDKNNLEFLTTDLKTNSILNKEVYIKPLNKSLQSYQQDTNIQIESKYTNSKKSNDLVKNNTDETKNILNSSYDKKDCKFNLDSFSKQSDSMPCNIVYDQYGGTSNEIYNEYDNCSAVSKQRHSAEICKIPDKVNTNDSYNNKNNVKMNNTIYETQTDMTSLSNDNIASIYNSTLKGNTMENANEAKNEDNNKSNPNISEDESSTNRTIIENFSSESYLFGINVGEKLLNSTKFETYDTKKHYDHNDRILQIKSTNILNRQLPVKTPENIFLDYDKKIIAYYIKQDMESSKISRKAITENLVFNDVNSCLEKKQLLDGNSDEKSMNLLVNVSHNINMLKDNNKNSNQTLFEFKCNENVNNVISYNENDNLSVDFNESSITSCQANGNKSFANYYNHIKNKIAHSSFFDNIKDATLGKIANDIVPYFANSVAEILTVEGNEKNDLHNNVSTVANIEHVVSSELIDLKTKNNANCLLLDKDLFDTGFTGQFEPLNEQYIDKITEQSIENQKKSYLYGHYTNQSICKSNAIPDNYMLSSKESIFANKQNTLLSVSNNNCKSVSRKPKIASHIAEKENECIQSIESNTPNDISITTPRITYISKSSTSRTNQEFEASDYKILSKSENCYTTKFRANNNSNQLMNIKSLKYYNNNSKRSARFPNGFMSHRDNVSPSPESIHSSNVTPTYNSNYLSYSHPLDEKNKIDVIKESLLNHSLNSEQFSKLHKVDASNILREDLDSKSKQNYNNEMNINYDGKTKRHDLDLLHLYIDNSTGYNIKEISMKKYADVTFNKNNMTCSRKMCKNTTQDQAIIRERSSESELINCSNGIFKLNESAQYNIKDIIEKFNNIHNSLMYMDNSKKNTIIEHATNEQTVFARSELQHTKNIANKPDLRNDNRSYENKQVSNDIHSYMQSSNLTLIHPVLAHNSLSANQFNDSHTYTTTNKININTKSNNSKIASKYNTNNNNEVYIQEYSNFMDESNTNNYEHHIIESSNRSCISKNYENKYSISPSNMFQKKNFSNSSKNSNYKINDYDVIVKNIKKNGNTASKISCIMNNSEDLCNRTYQVPHMLKNAVNNNTGEVGIENKLKINTSNKLANTCIEFASTIKATSEAQLNDKISIELHRSNEYTLNTAKQYFIRPNMTVIENNLVRSKIKTNNTSNLRNNKASQANSKFLNNKRNNNQSRQSFNNSSANYIKKTDNSQCMPVNIEHNTSSRLIIDENNIVAKSSKRFIISKEIKRNTNLISDNTSFPPIEINSKGKIQSFCAVNAIGNANSNEQINNKNKAETLNKSKYEKISLSLNLAEDSDAILNVPDQEVYTSNKSLNQSDTNMIEKIENDKAMAVPTIVNSQKIKDYLSKTVMRYGKKSHFIVKSNYNR